MAAAPTASTAPAVSSSSVPENNTRESVSLVSSISSLLLLHRQRLSRERGRLGPGGPALGDRVARGSGPLTRAARGDLIHRDRRPSLKSPDALTRSAGGHDGSGTFD